MKKEENVYEVGYSFHFCEDAFFKEEILNLADKIREIPCVKHLRFDENEEDFIIYLIAVIYTNFDNVSALWNVFEKEMHDNGIEYSGDYHYIKGIDNNFFWEP